MVQRHVRYMQQLAQLT